MGILALPNELLLIILDLSRPYNFEKLVLSCKQICAAATPLIRCHNFWRKYYNFEFGSKTVRSIPELLAKLQRIPKLLRTSSIWT